MLHRLALEFFGERRDGHQQLVGGGVERPLTVFEVEEHPNARRDQLLQGVGGLDGLGPSRDSSDMIRPETAAVA